MSTNQSAKQVDSFKELIRAKLFGKDFKDSDPNKPLTKEDLEKRFLNIQDHKISQVAKQGLLIGDTFDKWFGDMRSNVMNMDAIRKLFNQIRSEMDAAITESSESSGEEGTGSKVKKKKSKPSDDLSKKFMM